MRPIRIRRLTALLVSGVMVVSTAAAVHAQDGRNFFEQLFGIPARPAPVQPSYGQPGFYPDNAMRPQRPRARYAALPKADAIGTGKQPVDQKAIQDNPTKAILNDRTLRPGDIVVLPGGPRVFTGDAFEKRHSLSDFEDVKHSGMVDKKTRQELLAKMVPVGAMPADQARKVLAQKRRLAQPDEIAAVEARNAAGARVINPWQAAQ